MFSKICEALELMERIIKEHIIYEGFVGGLVEQANYAIFNKGEKKNYSYSRLSFCEQVDWTT